MNNNEMRHRIRQVINKGMVILAFGLSYAVWLSVTHMGIPCLIKLVTGLTCPGCGISRMCMALLHGELKTAYFYNPGVLLSLPVLVGLLGISAARYIITGKKEFSKLEYVIYGLLVLYYLGYAVLRNIAV